MAFLRVVKRKGKSYQYWQMSVRVRGRKNPKTVYLGKDKDGLLRRIVGRPQPGLRDAMQMQKASDEFKLNHVDPYDRYLTEKAVQQIEARAAKDEAAKENASDESVQASTDHGSDGKCGEGDPSAGQL